MIKNSKPVLFLLLLLQLLFFQSICGQTPSDMTDYLKQRFLRYCKSIPREEIYIHNDRDEYISGEDLWFDIFLIDRQSFKLSLNSRIVYFELLNSESRPIVQKRILIDKGAGPGQIVLPDTLSSGIYTIRAYTSWMKNFLPDNCFVRNITVYNALSTKINKRNILKNNYGTTVPDKNGSLQTINAGVNLRIINSGKDTLVLSVDTDTKFRSENGSLIYGFIQTHGNINNVFNRKLSDKTCRIAVPRSSLSTGINQVTIFNSKGVPVSERYIYTAAKRDRIIEVHSDDSCGLRSKVNIKIAKGSLGASGINIANLSISVAPITDNQDLIDIDDYLLFGTEFGLQPLNLISGRKIDQISTDEIDSILLNVRSNWINWEQILSEENHHFKYMMEKEDHYLLGKLIEKDQKTIHPGEYVILCSPGKDASFQYARTDSAGNFSFKIRIDETLKDLIILPDNISKNQSVIIESSFSDRYSKLGVPVDSSENNLSPSISKLSVNHQVQTIFGINDKQNSATRVFHPLIPARFYGKPDIELVLADYIKLPVMSEIFFELLPGVSLKQKKSKYDISITERVYEGVIDYIPTLMIDGVIIQDPSLIVSLDPEIVERIDVIKGKYLVGKYFFSGIVNVITKSCDLSCITLPAYMTRLSYKVTDPVMSFISPDYSSLEKMESRIPDYRNTLYWNPSLKPDKDGDAGIEFWSSDNKSDYIINIQGITSDGRLISLRKNIKVK
jgi:hypothetical protein